MTLFVRRFLDTCPDTYLSPSLRSCDERLTYDISPQSEGLTHVYVNVAGYAKEMITVSRNGDILTVQAQLPQGDASASAQPPYGSMIATRARLDLRLSSDTVIDTASLRDGMLLIAVRSTPADASRVTIPIQ